MLFNKIFNLIFKNKEDSTSVAPQDLLLISDTNTKDLDNSGYNIALDYLKDHEVHDNLKLKAFFRKYAKNGDIDINPATTPWCAAFVNACERAVGKPGTGMLNARSFLKYGRIIQLHEAKRGDIVIFTRGSNSVQGHVAYFDGIDGAYIKTLGGNQNDSVCFSLYSKFRLLGIRRHE